MKSTWCPFNFEKLTWIILLQKRQFRIFWCCVKTIDPSSSDPPTTLEENVLIFLEEFKTFFEVLVKAPKFEIEISALTKIAIYLCHLLLRENWLTPKFSYFLLFVKWIWLMVLLIWSRNFLGNGFYLIRAVSGPSFMFIPNTSSSIEPVRLANIGPV